MCCVGSRSIALHWLVLCLFLFNHFTIVYSYILVLQIAWKKILSFYIHRSSKIDRSFCNTQHHMLMCSSSCLHKSFQFLYSPFPFNYLITNLVHIRFDDLLNFILFFFLFPLQFQIHSLQINVVNLNDFFYLWFKNSNRYISFGKMKKMYENYNFIPSICHCILCFQNGKNKPLCFKLVWTNTTNLCLKFFEMMKMATLW